MMPSTYTEGGGFRWKLRETLDTHNITRYALQKRAGIAMNTVRAMYDGTPERVDLPVIARVVTALAELTGRPMTAADVLTWESNDNGETELPQDSAGNLAGQLAELEADTPAADLQNWAAAFESRGA